MDVKEIQSLIKFVAKSGASEVKLEMEDIKITIRTGSTGSSTPETTIVQQIPVAQQRADLHPHPFHQHHMSRSVQGASEISPQKQRRQWKRMHR